MNTWTLYCTWICLILFCSPGLFAQQENEVVGNNQFDTWFTKSGLIQKTGELSFNVVNITNKTKENLAIKPRLSVPDGFSVFSKAFTDTVVPANSTIRLPYRLSISNEAAGNTGHQIVFRLFSDNNSLLLENTSVVKPETFHDWNVNLPVNRAFFYPRYNLAEFEVVLTNNGNTGELISLEIKPDSKLSFSDNMAKDWKAEQTIYLKPKSDSTVTFKVNYTSSADRVFDVSKVYVTATTKDKEIHKTAFIEKYVDEYTTLIVDNTMPHSAEAGLRSNTLTNSESVEPFVSARGIFDFKNDSKFTYFYSNYRLNQSDNFIRNSNYRFLYSWEGLNIGLGNFGSQLGRNLYSRNAFMVNYTNDLTPSHKIEAYASQDILDPKTGLAAGHWWDNEKYNLHTALSYNRNQVNKINTTSLLFSSQEFPIFKQQTVTAVLYGLREDYSFANPYSQQGLAWDLVFMGNIGSRFRYRVINNFGTPDIPGNQMGLFNIRTLLNFYPGDPMTYFSMTYNYYSRDFYYRDLYGNKLPDIFLQDQYAGIIYNNHRNINFIWSLGPSYESYFALRPELTDFDYSRYNIKRYSIEFRSYLMKDMRFDLDAGIRDVFYKGDKVIESSKLDMHLTTYYSKGGYGVRVKYDHGPLAYNGLYQRVTDLDYHGVSIGPFISKMYANKRINLQLYSNYIYRFDLNYSFLNISSQVEIYLARNWYTKLLGNFNYFKQISPEYKSENSNYYVAASVIKKWGNSEYTRKQKQLRRLKIVCFKDENGNGRLDKYENGIPFIKTRLKLISEEIQPTHESFPIDIALLTNEEGFVIYNQIPKGFYEVEVIPLTDMREYFYVSKTHEQIDLIDNMTYYIPFQKASKIDGRLVVQRAKFATDNIDLSRIKITAYNKAGNSYSSFTRSDGDFTIFVPGDTTYYLRMENVFGSKFKILQNDIVKKVPDPSNEPVIFEIAESSKQINFKKANQPADGGPQKTKILKGKIYENTDREPVDTQALPEFDMKDGTSFERNITPGKFYVVLEQNLSRSDALKTVGIYRESGVEVYFGFDAGTSTHYVIKNEYASRSEAIIGLRKLREKGVQSAVIMVFK